MPIDPGSGTGGGSALSVCAISPSDLIGTLDNLITRLNNLEFAVSQMLGGNITANQLSDVAENAGWIYGVNYMGTPGWIQTPNGTLIPPTGFTFSNMGWTLSDGTPWSALAVTQDSDGVYHYPLGVKPDGNLFGDNVDAWNTAAANVPGPADYCRIIRDSGLGTTITDVRGNISLVSTTITTTTLEIRVSVGTAGLYRVTSNAQGRSADSYATPGDGTVDSVHYIYEESPILSGTAIGNAYRVHGHTDNNGIMTIYSCISSVGTIAAGQEITAWLHPHFTLSTTYPPGIYHIDICMERISL